MARTYATGALTVQLLGRPPEAADLETFPRRLLAHPITLSELASPADSSERLVGTPVTGSRCRRRW